jgi:NADH-quinone oxidoreductase subunit E
VATFYTQYFKEDKGKVVLDVCTCFTCQVCGGYDMLHYIEGKLGITKGETTADGMFTVQEAECLGACGSAPMLQVTNGPYVHNLTTAKVDALIDTLRAGGDVPFESVTLPQDQDELQGNRRTDAAAVEGPVVPPVSATIH